MAAESNVQAGNAFIRIWLKSENVGDFLNTLGKKITAFGQRLNSIGKRMAITAIVMATPFVAGTRVFADFSKQMAFVSTMLDDSDKYMKGYTETVRSLSVEFGESTKEMSRGLYDILSAGFEADKALSMLNITIKAGKAGMADSAQSTAAIIAVLNAYGLTAGHAQEVSDTLFQTVRYGVLTFGELAGHIGLVAPSAAQAGVTLDELGATLAIITRSGIETSHAVVALNNILKAFMAPTGAGADFAEKLREAGFAFEMSIAGIKKAGFANIIAEIGKLPTEAIAKLFPSIRSQRGILAVKSGLAALPIILEKMNEKMGATDRAFEKIRKSFGFLVDRAKQAGILILSYLGEALANSLKGAGESFIYFARGFGKWLKLNKAAIKNTVKLITTYMMLALTLIAVGKAIALVGIIMAAVTGPWGWAKLILGVAAGVAAWQALGKAMGSVRQELSEIAKIGRDVTKVELGKDLASATLTRKAEVLGKIIAIERERWEELKEGVRKARKEVEDLEQAKIRASISVVALPLVPSVIRELQSAKELLNTRILEHRVLRDTVKALERKLTVLKRESIIAGLSEKAQEKRRKDAQAERDAIAAATRFFRRGYFLGYWHTPSLAYATSTPETQQLEVLRDIKENTANTVAEIGKMNKVQ